MKLFEISPLATTFGARIAGVDLTQEIQDAAARMIVEALLRHRLLVFDRQELSHGDQIRVSRLFGEPEVYIQDQYAVAGFPQITTISNIHVDGSPIGLYDGDDEQEWHADLSWKPRLSAVSLLYAVIAPSAGGETRFADTTAAYDALPNGTKARISGLRAVHSMRHLFEQQLDENPGKIPFTAEQQAQLHDVEHPLVRTHPQTGCRSLLLGDKIIRNVADLPARQSRQLLDHLHAHATHDRFVYTHRWKEGDLVIWDNRAVIHTASPCDHTRHQRLLYRTTVM